MFSVCVTPFDSTSSISSSGRTGSGINFDHVRAIAGEEGVKVSVVSDAGTVMIYSFSRFVTPPLPGRPNKKFKASSDAMFCTISSPVLKAKISTVGASLMSLVIAGADVVLGYDDPSAYFSNPCYFGSTIGRVANRIKGGELVLSKKGGEAQ